MSGAAVVVAFLLYYPWWEGLPTFLRSLGGPASRSMTKSLTAWVHHRLPPSSFGSWAVARLPPRLPLVSMVALCLVLTAFVRRRRDAYRASGWYAFFWCTIGAAWFMPWYVTWAIPLALLSGAQALRQATILLSLLVPLIYVVHAGGWSFADLLSDLLVENYQLIVFVPPLVTATWMSLQSRQSASQGVASMPER
jgi:hypothetical protein